LEKEFDFVQRTYEFELKNFLANTAMLLISGCTVTVTIDNINMTKKPTGRLCPQYHHGTC
jgi:heme/copper-type cytochrome/quinol oxidase subunit 3